MVIYKDVFTGDTYFTNEYPIKSVEEGLGFEIKSKIPLKRKDGTFDSAEVVNTWLFFIWYLFYGIFDK